MAANRIINTSGLDLDVDRRELEYEGKISITLSTRYGGDSGTAIEYNSNTNQWDLVEWDSNDPYVIESNKDPLELIRYEQGLT